MNREESLQRELIEKTLNKKQTYKLCLEAFSKAPILTDFGRKNLVRRLMAYQLSEDNIDSVGLTFTKFKDSNTTGTFLDNKTVLFDEDIFKECTQAALVRNLQTVFHEMRHNLDFRVVKKNQKKYQDKVMSDYKKGFSDKFDRYGLFFNLSHSRYYLNTMEVRAREDAYLKTKNFLHSVREYVARTTDVYFQYNDISGMLKELEIQREEQEYSFFNSQVSLYPHESKIEKRVAKWQDKFVEKYKRHYTNKVRAEQNGETVTAKKEKYYLDNYYDDNKIYFFSDSLLHNSNRTTARSFLELLKNNKKYAHAREIINHPRFNHNSHDLNFLLDIYAYNSGRSAAMAIMFAQLDNVRGVELLNEFLKEYGVVNTAISIATIISDKSKTLIDIDESQRMIEDLLKLPVQETQKTRDYLDTISMHYSENYNINDIQSIRENFYKVQESVLKLYTYKHIEGKEEEKEIFFEEYNSIEKDREKFVETIRENKGNCASKVLSKILSSNVDSSAEMENEQVLENKPLAITSIKEDVEKTEEVLEVCQDIETNCQNKSNYCHECI